jgi:hypothetical protein
MPVRNRVLLRIVGMYFDIEKALVYLLDEKRERFYPVTDAEAAETAALEIPSAASVVSNLLYI